MERVLRAAIFSALVLWLGCHLAYAGAAQAKAANEEATKALAAQGFLDTIGVGVHMGYTDGAYASVEQAIEDLRFLGIHQLRDGLPDPAGGIPARNFAASLQALLNAGNSFDFLVSPRLPLAVFRGEVDAIARHYPGAVIAVEGPNEINNWPVSYKAMTGDAGANAYQHDLYAMVKADASLRAVPVYYLTGNKSIDLYATPGLADYANTHPYPYRGQPPGPRLASEFRRDFSMTAPYPNVITETGYFNQPNGPGGSGVDDQTQAKLTLDLLFDAFQRGVAKTFLYQLRTAYPDPKGDNADTEYGLFNLDNSPKPAAIAIHNLTTILSDTGLATGSLADGRLGASFPDAGSLAYSLAGMPDTGRSVLLQKSDGSFALVLWAEPLIWNEARHTAISVPETMVTLSLPAPARSIRVVDPLHSTAACRTGAETNSIRIGLGDHPVVVEIRQ